MAKIGDGTDKQPFRYPYYTTFELARAATAPKLSTKTRIEMLDEILRRDVEAAAAAIPKAGA